MYIWVVGLRKFQLHFSLPTLYDPGYLSESSAIPLLTQFQFTPYCWPIAIQHWWVSLSSLYSLILCLAPLSFTLWVSMTMSVVNNPSSPHPLPCSPCLASSSPQHAFALTQRLDWAGYLTSKVDCIWKESWMMLLGFVWPMVSSPCCTLDSYFTLQYSLITKIYSTNGKDEDFSFHCM